MKKEWNKFEGALVRFDVGSSSTQALDEGFPAEVICFTSDGYIVFNGIQYSLSQAEYNAIVESKVDKMEGYALASERQLYVADWCDTHILTYNHSSVPFLKAMDGGDKGIALSHALDGDTYHTDTYIPLATDTSAGVMSAEDHTDFTTAKEDIEQLFEMADESDKKVAANAEAIVALDSKVGMQSANIMPPFDGIQLSTAILSTDTYDGEGTAEADAVMFYKAQKCFIASIGTRWYTRWRNLSNIPDYTAYQYTYLNKRPLLHNSSRTLYVWDGETSLLPITHQWQVLTSAQYEALQYKDENTFYYILEDD